MVQIQGCGGDEAPRIWEEVDWGAAVGRGKGGETEVEWDVVVELPKLGLRHWQRAQLARPPAGEHGKFALWGPIQVLGGSSQCSLHWSGPCCCYGPTWGGAAGHSASRPRRPCQPAADDSALHGACAVDILQLQVPQQAALGGPGQGATEGDALALGPAAGSDHASHDWIRGGGRALAEGGDLAVKDAGAGADAKMRRPRPFRGRRANG
jgi:hypothetical protein